nr:site-specific DNA-methyltransferase [Deltaproteobacteria bacterium]
MLAERTPYNEQFDTELQDTIDANRWSAYVNEKGEILGKKMPSHDSRFVRYLKKWIKNHGRDPDPNDVVFEVRGQPVDSVWHMKGLDPKSTEKVGYPTQKPEDLLQRVIDSSTNPGDLVADFFCGSGTTLAVAEKLGRRWVGCDLGRWAIHVTRKRLLGIESCKPFEILNLGKYERQYWQGITFGKAKGKHLTEQALYEYLAFILKLYGA